MLKTREAGKIEYEDLENGNLECNLISKIPILKKSDGNLEFNFKNDSLDKRHSKTVLYVGNLSWELWEHTHERLQQHINHLCVKESKLPKYIQNHPS